MRALAIVYSLAVLQSSPILAVEISAKPYVVLSGSQSHVSKAATHLITSRQAWTNLWLEHVGEKPDVEYSQFYNRAGVPEVDFNACMVVAVFVGSASNNAGLTVHSTEEIDGVLVIRFDMKSYQSRGGADDGAPYGFFIIPRTEQAVLLQVNKQSYRSRIEKGPPAWKDFHRLAAR